MDVYKRLWKRFIKSSIKGILKFPCRYRISVNGKENLPDGKAIIAANHISFIDPMFLVMSSDEEIYFLTKHYISPAGGFEKSFFGKLLISLDQIILKDGEIDKKTLKKSLAVLDKGWKLGIFPEGTRSEDGKLKRGYNGSAFISYISNAPVVPVGLNGTYEIWPRDKKFPRLYGNVKINIGKAIYPDYSIGKKEAISKLTDVIMDTINRLVNS